MSATTRRRLWSRRGEALADVLILGGAEGKGEQVIEIQRVVSLVLEEDLRELNRPLPPLNAKIATIAFLHGTTV